MKKHLTFLVVLAFIFSFSGRSQQDFLVSQTFVNPSLVNPSLAAFSDNWEVGVMVRSQWVGHKNSPNTQILSISGTLGKPKSRRSYSGRIRLNRPTEFAGGKRLFHAVAVNMINDKAGAFGRMDAQIHWSPILRLSKKVYAGIGPTVRLARFQIDPDRIDFLVRNDFAWDMLQTADLSHQSLGLNVDGLIFTTNAYVGISILDPLKARWLGVESSQLLLDRGFLLTGGYTHHIDSRWDVDAVVSNRFVQGTPYALDATVRAVYQQSLWVGVGYRANAAMSFTLGSLLGNKLRCSYAIERGMLAISNQLGWSHEFYLSYVLPAKSDLKF